MSVRRDKPCWVYLHLSADAEALYMGCTNDRVQRSRQHAADSPWWPLVADIVHVGPFDRVTAHAIERGWIAELEPLHNVRSTSRDPRTRRARGLVDHPAVAGAA